MNKYRIIERYTEDEEVWFMPQQFVKWKFLWWNGERWKSLTGSFYKELSVAEAKIRIHKKNNYKEITVVKEFN